MGFCRSAIVGACALALAALAGCQSPQTSDVLESASQDKASVSSDASQTVGTGGARIDVFVDGSVSQAAIDYRDGAALAAKELGAGQLTLTVHDLRSVPGGDPAAEIGKTAAGGSKLFIGPPSLAKAFGTSSGGAASILLGSEPDGTGVAIVSDEIDGLIEVAAYAAGARRTKIMAVAARPLSASEKQRLQAGLKQAGVQLLDIVTDPSSAAGQKSLAKLGEAQAVLLIGSEAPSVIAPALRQRAGLDASVPFLGTYTWRSNSYAEPALQGSLLALVDQTALQRISKRFQAAYGRPLSLEAAYAFDAVAVAAGVVRSKGSDALTASALRANSGFAGATGVFRFGSNGRVERRFAIYQLSGGKPAILDAAPAGF